MREHGAVRPVRDRPAGVAARAVSAALLLAIVTTGFSLVRVLVQENSPQVDAIYDWAQDYETLKELLATPGAVAVIGTVTSIDGPIAESTVTLDEVLVGSEVELGDAVVVQQFGARSGRTAHEPGDALHLELGERVLLALAYDEMRDRYFIVGGPHGHFTIDGTRITQANYGSREYGLSQDHPDGHPLALLADSLTPNEFRRRVIEAAPE